MRIKAEEISKARKEKGLSMRQLAKISNVSISQVSDLESGQLKNTTIDTICKIANVLEIKPTDLFTCD